MNLTIELKKNLGCIIKENRKFKYEEYKGINSESINPYTKENFSNGVCHYHTLTKLEVIIFMMIIFITLY